MGLRVLMSAYACEPDKGSEPGVGWHLANEMAKHHHVWVLTRANNRSAIEAAQRESPSPNLHFEYFDIPKALRWWKRGPRGVQIYYYMWQIGAYFVARRLHRSNAFEVVHHATFAKYWAPSFLSLLPIPFVWGPAGGGESTPAAFWTTLGAAGRIHEGLRHFARLLAELDPFVLLTARRSRIALATTDSTARRLKTVGARDVRVLSQVGVSEMELRRLGNEALMQNVPSGRFVSIGNLLPWKGFDLGLRAFAQAGIEGAEYWIIGDGPDRERLEALAESLGIRTQVKLFGQLSRARTLECLQQCSALVHPSLHDSGGLVCVEAMASRKPVVCLDLGGPALQVTESTGFKIPTKSPKQAVCDIASAMQKLATDEALRQQMGDAGWRRASETFGWSRKGDQISAFYIAAATSR